MSYFNEFIATLDEVVGYKYIMSFILVFAVVLGLLDVSGIFRRRETHNNQIIEKKMWTLQVLIALAVTFLALYNPSTSEWIFRAVTEFTNWVLIAFMGIVILYVFSKVVIFKGEEEEEIVARRFTRSIKITAFSIGVIVFFYFLNKYAPNVFLFMNTRALIPVIILIGILAIPIVWIYYMHFRNNYPRSPQQIRQMYTAKNIAFHDCMKRRTDYYLEKGYDLESARARALEDCKESPHLKY